MGPFSFKNIKRQVQKIFCSSIEANIYRVSYILDNYCYWSDLIVMELRVKKKDFYIILKY